MPHFAKSRLVLGLPRLYTVKDYRSTENKGKLSKFAYKLSMMLIPCNGAKEKRDYTSNGHKTQQLVYYTTVLWSFPYDLVVLKLCTEATHLDHLDKMQTISDPIFKIHYLTDYLTQDNLSVSEHKIHCLNLDTITHDKNAEPFCWYEQNICIQNIPNP